MCKNNNKEIEEFIQLITKLNSMRNNEIINEQDIEELRKLKQSEVD